MDFLQVAFVSGVSSYSEAIPLSLVKLRPNNVNQNNLVRLKIFLSDYYYREYKKQACEIAFQFVMTSFVKS